MSKWNDKVYDAGNIAFIEGLYEDFLNDPTSVSEVWRDHFEALHDNSDGSGANGSYVSHTELQRELVRLVKYEPARYRSAGKGIACDSDSWGQKQAAVLDLVTAYRLHGHLRATIDPLGYTPRPFVKELDPASHGLDEGDMGRLFHTGTFPAANQLPLHELLTILKETYCTNIGVEYMHIADAEQKEWLQTRIETTQANPSFSPKEKKNILGLLTAAEGLERYLHTRYSGKKRFSLEGGESLIPLLDTVIQQSGSFGVKEIVLGMAHRGRLNVLVNSMGKQPKNLFEEFEKGSVILGDKMTGDVKYHQGYSSDVMTSGGPVHLSLAYNPSHLEIISPVVCGSARARQDNLNDTKGNTVVPIMIHGDSAISGQGVVYETLNLSGLRGFKVGGSVHVVVNNQIGFTTNHPEDTRTGVYCTDVGKSLDCPIFHVNGDDPEAVVFVAKLAIEFRMRFNIDVFIDMVCYRRHGHNEGDLPLATQPRMYKLISEQRSVLTMYREKLVNKGEVTETMAQQMAEEYRDALDKGDYVNSKVLPDYTYTFENRWDRFRGGHWSEKVNTSVVLPTLKKLGKLATALPKNFSPHKGVQKIIDDRHKMLTGKQPLDWGAAEIMAYATLLDDGYAVRFVGQDARRGTFFHRHATVHDQATGETYTALRHLHPDQPEFWIIDSILSEEAVLAYEYGYSTCEPNTLVVWEAQYGDFVNGAQVVIDQFISSCEQKWNIFTGLVMMLPHGWEGQGPEHSSARLERFLQLCSAENMCVCIPSTPAQMFHMLRRQMRRKCRMPLIIMSPKSMLRRKESFVDLQELAEGTFQVVIGEQELKKNKQVRRACLCSGKVYYEMLKKRRKEKLTNVALIRIEQLYPFPLEALKNELGKYPNLVDVIWVQEEPKNQGAWYQIDHQLKKALQPHHKLFFTGRISCSAPAGGSPARHEARERLLVEAALGLGPDAKGDDYSTPF